MRINGKDTQSFDEFGEQRFHWIWTISDDLSYIQIKNIFSGELLSVRENVEIINGFQFNRVVLAPVDCQRDSCKWRLIDTIPSTHDTAEMYCRRI